MILRVWDNGGISFDRYTVRIRNDYYGMSHDPNSPQGFNQYLGSYPDIGEAQLGKVFTMYQYRALPLAVREAITERT